MLRLRRSVFTLIGLMSCALVGMTPAPAIAQRVDPLEASRRILQRATEPQRDGSHLSLLFALRQLRDPDLQPFFTQLVQSTHWQIQVHGVLGLGEISTTKRIDEMLVRRLQPPAQDAVIATALDLELLSPEQFDAILAWDDLQPMARLVLLSELVSMNKPVNREQLLALSEGPDDPITALASCLLVQLGEKGSFATFKSRLASMEARKKNEIELWTIEAIRRYKLTACLPWVRELVDRSTETNELAYRGIYALLELDEPTGMAAWAQRLGNSPTYAQRVRFAMLLLASQAESSAKAFDRLNPAADEELLQRMIAVGKAMLGTGDFTTAMTQLIAANHSKSTEWAMEYLTTIPDEQAAPIYTQLVDRITDQSTSDHVALAVTAASRLHRTDPNAVMTRLAASTDDSSLQQALLLGLFETEAAAVGETARTIRRIGSSRADSLALLLVAKHSKAMQPADIEQLGKIASGGGNVSEVLQVQAAWMYLKHTGQAASSLALLFPAATARQD